MNIRMSALLAGSSLLVIASISGVHAAPAAAQPQQLAAAADDTGTEEIVVTARRKAELLQDVPETVDVVTAESIGKYSVLEFTDVSKLIPGLQLVKSSNGFETSASVRGISYNEDQAVPATVTYYQNDVPIDSNILFQSLFDVGQIEVLKGPTGTLRGLISPSGSITITTHRADLDKWGGYAQATVGSLRDQNFQGALNIPVVEDKFALRISGVEDRTDGGGVRSVFSAVAPSTRTEGSRVTARFAPNDNLNINLTAEHISAHEQTFGEVFGAGAPGGIVPNATFAAPPAGYNGPVIGTNQLLSVSSFPTVVSQRATTFDGSVDYTFHGQKLSYVGSWNSIGVLSESADQSVFLPGYVGGPTVATATTSRTWSQELRLSSVDPLFGHLDYTVGAFTNKALTRGGYDGIPGETTLTALSGAYGQPNAPVVGPPNRAYYLESDIQVPSNVYQYAGYGSLTYHFDQKTELTAGMRVSEEKLDYALFLTYPHSALDAAAVPLPPGVPCSAAHLAASPYPGYCTVTVTQAPNTLISNHSYKPVTYNVELSHKFTDDLMVYARTASAFRPPNIQYATAITGAQIQALQPYILPKPETSKDYEVGVKGDLLDKRLLFDIDFFHQVFNNFFYTTLPFYYLSQSIVPGAATTVGNTSVTANANAVVNGVEFHAVAKVTPEWTITPAVSWANGHLSGASIPCSPPSPTTPPTVAYFTGLGQSIFTCKSNVSTSSAPRWNATLQSEFYHPITDGIDGFVRGLLYYYPSNPNSSTTYIVPAYATVDLYLGVRHPDSQWEVNAYGKNLFNNQTITQEGFTQTTSAYFGNSGYFSIAHVNRREFGLTVKYAFGSR